MVELCRPLVSGLERIPGDGPLIVASNHLSAIDTLFLSVLLRRRVTFLAKAEYFSQSGVRGRAMSGLMSACGFVAVDRASPAAGRAVIDRGLQVLASGGALGVYPEGTRSTDGRLTVAARAWHGWPSSQARRSFRWLSSAPGACYRPGGAFRGFTRYNCALGSRSGSSGNRESQFTTARNYAPPLRR